MAEPKPAAPAVETEADGLVVAPPSPGAVVVASVMVLCPPVVVAFPNGAEELASVLLSVTAAVGTLVVSMTLPELAVLTLSVVLSVTLPEPVVRAAPVAAVRTEPVAEPEAVSFAE